MSTSSIVQKVWNYCHTLRDDGVGYGDYLEQLTFLLFLKMAHEYSLPPYDRDTQIPEEFSWEVLRDLSGAELEERYVDALRGLGNEKGMIGRIFFKAQNKIQDPAKLHRLVSMIDKESWIMLGADVKGDIYEGLLKKNAEDTKSGAGQYFTPRSLIRAMVECVRPEPMKTIADPSCGTGGFFLAAHEYLLKNNLDKEQKKFLKYQTFHGWEIVASTTRLCLMNLFLHNIGDLNSEPPVHRADALLTEPPQKYDYVLANPPFGKKSSITITADDGTQKKEALTYNRQDFWGTTSNKQLNFVQHIRSMLKIGGTAAVVLPDNVLFEGGAGETVRKKLLETCNVHTILRLPTGIFYAQGVKANVVFFESMPAAKDPWTQAVWYYDLRTNKHFTLKTRQMGFADLEPFIECYQPQNRENSKELWSEDNPQGRWRKYTLAELVQRDKTSLDVFWLKDDSLTDVENLPEPDVLASEIIQEVEGALQGFRDLLEGLEQK